MRGASEGHDVAQICLNGHVINSSHVRMPEFSADHCKDCGAETITQCPSCNADIRGSYWSPGIISFDTFDAPKYCVGCGGPYPWTSARLSAAQELAGELDGLSDEDRELLKLSLLEIAINGPRTELGASRVKRLLLQAGQGAGSAIYSVVMEFASATAAKIITSGPS